MSELIYPDEALPEINTENPLASELIFNGVGIYFSDDNLVTVINIVDGSAGIATDITNNLLGEVSGDYSVGADISSLTIDQQLQINDNPYQLFKTNETVEQEYALVFKNDSTQGVEIGGLSGTNGSVYLTLAEDFVGGSGKEYLLDTRRSIGGLTATGGDVVAKIDGAWYTGGVTSITINGVVSVAADIDNTSKGDVIGLHGVNFDISGGAIIIGTRYSLTNGRTETLKLSVLRITDASLSRFWDFNQTRGDYVEDHYNGAIATLVGFGADSGYLRDDITGQLAGYQFGTATAPLPLVGAYTGLITYTDDTTLAISGSGAYLVNTGIIASITVTDTTGDLSFDCTTGDQGKIVETIQGKHAVISNDSVVKWQPIIPVEIFTVGSGVQYDYTLVKDFLNSVSDTSYIYRGMVYGQTLDVFSSSVMTSQGVSATNRLKVEVIAGDNYFDGSGVNENYHLDAFNFYVRRYVDLKIKGIRGRKVTLQGYGAQNNKYLVDSCMMTALGAANLFTNQLGTNTALLIKDSYLEGYRTTLISNSSTTGDLKVVNSVVKNCSGYGGLGYNIYKHVNVMNSLVFNQGTTSWGGTKRAFEPLTEGHNNISDDNTAVDTGIGTQADMTSWFDDNGQITEVGRTAIGTDTGWNGSTVCGWADAAGTPVTVTELTYSDSTLGLLADTIALQRTTSVDFIDSTLGMTADEMTLDELIELIFSDSTLGMTADEMSLTELINLVYSDATFGLTSNEIVLQKIVNLLFTDSTFGMTTDEISLARTTNVEFSDSTLAMVADEISLQRITNLLFNDSTLGMTADQIELSANIILEYLDSAFGMTADEISIQRSTALVFDSSTLGMTTDEISLVRTTNVSYFDSSFNLNADEITLTTGSMPNLGLNDVKLINASISYKLQDNNLAYSLQDNNPIYKLN
jgi:hypothetical protein